MFRSRSGPSRSSPFSVPRATGAPAKTSRHPHVLAYWQRRDHSFIDEPGAESFTEFFDRAREAIFRLEGADSGGCIVLFTHGYFMQAFRLVLLFPNATDAELMANFQRFHFVNLIQNADSLEFEVRDGKIRFIGQPRLTGFTLQGETSHA